MPSLPRPPLATACCGHGTPFTCVRTTNSILQGSFRFKRPLSFTERRREKPILLHFPTNGPLTPFHAGLLAMTLLSLHLVENVFISTHFFGLFLIVFICSFIDTLVLTLLGRNRCGGAVTKPTFQWYFYWI